MRIPCRLALGILSGCLCVTAAATNLQQGNSVSEKRSHNPAATFQAAESFLQRGEKERAVEVLSDLEGLGSGSGRLVTMAGTLLAQYGWFREASVFFRRALEIEPNLYEASYNLALAYLNMDKPLDAVNVLTRVQPQYRDRADYANLIGNAYWKLEDVSKAAFELQRACILEPNNENYYLDSGSFFLRFNTPRPAVDIFRAGLQHVPQSPRLHFALGVSLMLIEMYKDSEQHLQEAIRRDPKFPPPIFALAYTFYSSGKYEQAEQSLRRLITLTPDDYRALYLLVLSLKYQQEKRDVDEVELLLKRCLKHKPDYAPAHVELGSYYIRRQEFTKAIPCLASAIRTDTDLLDAHVLLATAYARLGDSEAARRQSELVRKLQVSKHSGKQADKDDPKQRILEYFVR